MFDDFGQATFRVIMRDPGAAFPSGLNDVTVTQYRVVYRGAAGLDVPRPINGALTITVSAGGTPATGVFEIVRHVAKLEPPLTNVALGTSVLSTIADVTFFGRDQAGNEVSVSGTVPINFANFN